MAFRTRFLCFFELCILGTNEREQIQENGFLLGMRLLTGLKLIKIMKSINSQLKRKYFFCLSLKSYRFLRNYELKPTSSANRAFGGFWEHLFAANHADAKMFTR